jgi:hypothetical protein
LYFRDDKVPGTGTGIRIFWSNHLILIRIEICSYGNRYFTRCGFFIPGRGNITVSCSPVMR